MSDFKWSIENIVKLFIIIKPMNMKFRNMLFISFIICFFLTVDAKSQVQYGVKGGLSLTKGKFEISSTDFAIRYQLGIMAQYNFTEKLYLSPELLFSQKGWRLPNDALNNNVNLTLSYLNVPVLIGFKLNKNISLFTGPEFGFKLSEKRNPSNGWSELYEKFDFGLAFGVIYEINSKFGIDLRYIHGFKGLINNNATFTDDYGNVIGETSIKDGSNRAIQIGIVYTFNRHK